MKVLKTKILECANIRENQIVKVDSFLNHQVDVNLLNKVGEEFSKRFSDVRIDRILTAEVSGIAIAAIVSQYFNVPMVFARKTESVNLSEDVYSTEIYSYTGKRNYKIKVGKNFLNKNENILIIDDFMANGKAAEGLIDLVDQAEANLMGIGVVIEKGFQEGGANLRSRGIRLESLAIIDSIDNNEIIFRD